MDAQVYLINCLTNLHVGSNTEDDDIIDQKVQRDPLNKLPMIQASGLKGAIREYFTFDPSVKAGVNDELRKKLFGSDKGGNDRSSMQRGGLKFFDARLLFYPLRVKEGNQSFYLATSAQLLNEFSAFHSWFTGAVMVEYKSDASTKLGTVETELGTKTIRRFNYSSLSKDIVVLEHDELANKLIEELPVIARNKLENGLSKNLWYEEVVPRESIFYTAVQKTVFKDANNFDFQSDFQRWLINNKIQIGANASVGYGECLFKTI